MTAKASKTEKMKKAADNDDNVDLQESVNELKEKFKLVFTHTEELKTMNGSPMKIELMDNVQIKPIHINTPRRTAYAYQNAAKAELDTLERQGILEKVKG